MDAQQKKFVFFLVLAVIVGMLVGGKLLPQKDLLRLKIGQAVVGVEVADTDEEKSQGLAGRDSLAADAGMMFVFELPGQYGFWMKGMKFGLDFVWIRQGKVVEVSENVSPEDPNRVYQPKEPVDAMVEVNAGWVKRQGVKVGDEVVK